MEDNKSDIVKRTLSAVKDVEEKFNKILENSALTISENGGLTKKEIDLLEQLIELSGEVNLAGNAIMKRYLSS